MVGLPVTAPTNEDPKTLLKLLVRDMDAWKRNIEKIHDEAGLDEWDEELIDSALTLLHSYLHGAVAELGSPFIRDVLVAAWREGQKEKAPAHTEA